MMPESVRAEAPEPAAACDLSHHDFLMHPEPSFRFLDES